MKILELYCGEKAGARYLDGERGYAQARANKFQRLIVHGYATQVHDRGTLPTPRSN